MTVTRWLFNRLLTADRESELLFRRELINACGAHLSVLKRIVLPAMSAYTHPVAQAAASTLNEVVRLGLSSLADFISARDAMAAHPSFESLEQHMDALRGIEVSTLQAAVQKYLSPAEAELLGQEVEGNLEQFGGRRAAQLAASK